MLRTMNTANVGGRLHLSIHMDRERHERLLGLIDRYGQLVGRDVSISLLLQRAVDLLDEHIGNMTDPVDALTERLALVGPARHPLPATKEE